MKKKDDKKHYEWDKDGDSFWLPMTSKNKEGKIEDHGHVRIRIDIVPKEYAEKNKVGSARSNPN